MRARSSEAEIYSPYHGLSLRGRRSPFRSTRSSRVTVIGGGIVGLSIARCLAPQGVRVVLLEKDRLGNGATSRSFAWINATFDKRPRSYFELNRMGVAAWRELEKELPGLQMQWGGSVEWALEASHARQLEADIENHRAWGYDVSRMDGDRLRSLEPNVEAGEPRVACHSHNEAHVDPDQVIRVLAEACKRSGVVVHERTAVVALGFDSRGAWCETEGGGPARRFESDDVVIACGADSGRVASLAGISVPLVDSPGLLIETRPVPRLVDRVVLAPGAHFRQKRDGSLLAGLDFGGGSELSLKEGAQEKVAQRLFEELVRRVPKLARKEESAPKLDPSRLARFTLGWRAMPADGYPIVGRARESPAYIAVMHSGVTLAPLIGHLVTGELLHGFELEVLEPYRPDRQSLSDA